MLFGVMGLTPGVLDAEDPLFVSFAGGGIYFFWQVRRIAALQAKRPAALLRTPPRPVAQGWRNPAHVNRAVPLRALQPAFIWRASQ